MNQLLPNVTNIIPKTDECQLWVSMAERYILSKATNLQTFTSFLRTMLRRVVIFTLLGTLSLNPCLGIWPTSFVRGSGCGITREIVLGRIGYKHPEVTTPCSFIQYHQVKPPSAIVDQKVLHEDFDPYPSTITTNTITTGTTTTTTTTSTTTTTGPQKLLSSSFLDNGRLLSEVDDFWTWIKRNSNPDYELAIF